MESVLAREGAAMMCYKSSTMKLVFLLAAVIWVQGAMAQDRAAEPAPWEKLLAERRWEDAEPLLRQALAATESPAVLRGLASVYRATGRLADADPLLERLLMLEDTFQNSEDLAGVKLALGKPDRAESLYRHSLELRGQTGEDELKSIAPHQRLAQVLQLLSEFREAEEEAQIAVAIRTRKLGPAHPDLAGDFSILANVYQAEKKYTEAASTWEEVVRLQEAAVGIEDVRLASSLDSLATCRRELAQWPQAEAALRRVLAIRELSQGQLHADVAQTMDTLARLLFATKRYAEAEPLYQRSLNIWMQLLGPGNSILALSYDNLAVTEAALRKYDAAEGLYLEAMKLRDDEDVGSLRNLALIHIAKNDYKDAEPLFKRALGALDTSYNRGSAQLGDVLRDYADVLRQLGRPSEAAKLETRLGNLKQADAPPPEAKR
jgi:tetratricopeptide (TPR) repeat protein